MLAFGTPGRQTARMSAKRTVITLAAMTMVATIGLGACGSSGNAANDGGAPGGDLLTGTLDTSRSTTTSTTTSSTGTGSSGPFVPGAVAFTDPQGTYTIDISPAWNETSGTLVHEIEAWQIGIGTSQFQDNVNVLTQDTQGLDLRAYLRFSEGHLGGMDLISSDVITGAAGNELGLIEYSGQLAGAPIELHALAAVAVQNGQAEVATLTTTMETFAQARAEAEPYLRTLQASAGA